MPVMLADIIEHLAKAERDLAVVGRFDHGEQSLHAALAAEADVLVVQRGALSDRTDSALADLLASRPLAVLVLSNDGRTADLYRIEPRTVRLDTFSNAFARAMRIAAQPES
jgi:DNA-binding NarL/FixJ family response regulator